jgi:hypothetical protein
MARKVGYIIARDNFRSLGGVDARLQHAII